MVSASLRDRGQIPVLWSFRRCPFAMRARLALHVSGQEVELREILLRDKPPGFLAASPTATVPCLETGAEVIDESLEIMLWALGWNDPEGWLNMPDEGHALIVACDGAFKAALDLYKYAARHPDSDPLEQRAAAAEFVGALEEKLSSGPCLFGKTPTLADMAILPFIRQYAHVDPDWFGAQPWPAVASWLERFKTSARYQAAMQKVPVWQEGDQAQFFP